jgi:hypothetical protein
MQDYQELPEEDEHSLPVLFKPMAVVQSYVTVNVSQQWSNGCLD